MALIDPRLFGGELQNPADVPTGPVGTGGVGSTVNTEPDLVPKEAGFLGSVPHLQGLGIQRHAERERAPGLASLGAGFVLTDTAAALRAVTDPYFKPDSTPLNTAELRQTLDFLPDEGEGPWIDGARSMPEWLHRVDRVRYLRTAREAQGDNPVAGLAGTVVGDAVYLATGAGSYGIARAFGKMPGLVAGAASGTALNVAAGASQPRDTAEVVLSMAGELLVPLAAFTKVTKQIEKVDPDYPAEELHAVTTQPGKPHIRLKPGATAPGGPVPGKPHIPVQRAAPEAVQTKAALDNPDALTDTPLMRQYTSTREAVQDLAQNATQPFIRQVMRLIAPHVQDGRVHVFDAADASIDPRVGEAMGSTTRALAVRTDEGVSVYINPKKNVGQETVAHELVHVATMKVLAENPELAKSFEELVTVVRANLLTDRGGKLSGMHKAEHAFFRKAFGDHVPDVDEFLAYAFTSPSFQRMMDNMDEVGAWLKPVPDAPKALTLYQKFARKVAALFGGTTKVAAEFAQAMRAREEAIKALGQVKTLRQELTERLGGVLEESPDALHPTYHEHAEVFEAVRNVAQFEAKSWSQTIGEKLQWNVRKTMSGYGAAGKKIADLLFDNNSDLSITSVESIQRAVASDLRNTFFEFTDGLRKAMAEDGHGLIDQMRKTGPAMKHQQKLHDDVQMEMHRRVDLGRQGKPITYENVPPRIKALADSLDKMYAQAATELKAAGVSGAEELQHYLGFHNRRWSSGNIVQMTDKFIAAGKTAEHAHQSVVRLLAQSMRRANDWDEKLSYNVAAETVNRALRRGLYEDAPLTAGSNELAAIIRDSLKTVGVTGPDAQRVLDVLVGKTDETGKAGFLKHRIELDYKVGVMLDGELLRVTDLIDNNITDIGEKYIAGVSTQVAFARKGLPKPSDITNLRAELMKDLERTPDKQREAKELFDGSLAKMRGEPYGQDMGRFLRNAQVFTRLVALPWSGLWQSTEIATAMQKYGALKTLNYAVKRMPGFKQLLADATRDPKTSQHLADILTRMSSNNLRMRPFVQRLEDGYELPESAVFDTRLQHMQQLIPYSNALKFIHNYQAGIVGNLVTDVVVSAAKGDAKAATHLLKYGVTADSLKMVREAVEKSGLAVDKWPHATWDAVRPAFAKMMDESVLHQRLGDTPAFAMLNPVGKFIFTFRGFTLTAHNKVLSGSIGRDGMAGASLLMLYQFPLTMLAVQAQAALNGKPALHDKELALRAAGQMGAFGWFTDAVKILSGDMQGFGNPAFIAVDRAIKTTGGIAGAISGEQGDLGQAFKDGVGLVPLVALPAKAIGAALQ